MTTLMTTTTLELRYYYSDLHCLPRLSDEERRHLQALLASAHGQPYLTPEAIHAKQRLIEGHLSLATSIAAKLCPSTHASALPDLVQAANLTLIEATNRFPFAEGATTTKAISQPVSAEA
jgi:DNA-directed RNA polymerase sigma subunit (sigma70/sigma32)